VDANELSDGAVVLAALVMEDAVEWLAGQDEEQIRWFEFPRPAQLNDVQRFIASMIESWNSWNGHWHWGIRTVRRPSLVGGVDLRDFGDGVFNLSYVIFPTFRNQGIATRASLLAIRFARDTLLAQTVVIKMLVGNEHSAMLAERLGAIYVGTEPSDAGGVFKVYRLDLSALPQPDVTGHDET
jgi:RimJ/RimL family protein N-acetyltransferase